MYSLVCIYIYMYLCLMSCTYAYSWVLRKTHWIYPTYPIHQSLEVLISSSDGVSSCLLVLVEWLPHFNQHWPDEFKANVSWNMPPKRNWKQNTKFSKWNPPIFLVGIHAEDILRDLHTVYHIYILYIYRYSDFPIVFFHIYKLSEVLVWFIFPQQQLDCFWASSPKHQERGAPAALAEQLKNCDYGEEGDTDAEKREAFKARRNVAHLAPILRMVRAACDVRIWRFPQNGGTLW